MSLKNMTRKSMIKVAGVTVGLLLSLFALSFMPTLFIRTPGMTELKGRHITVYHGQEKEAALDIFQLAEKESDRIAESLGFSVPQDIRIYIYDQQSVFQISAQRLSIASLTQPWANLR